jgi:hypothetical protein
MFPATLAEAAADACAEDYSLVRPVLIDLKRKYHTAGFALETGCIGYIQAVTQL